MYQLGDPIPTWERIPMLVENTTVEGGLIGIVNPSITKKSPLHMLPLVIVVRLPAGNVLWYGVQCFRIAAPRLLELNGHPWAVEPDG